MLICLDRSDSYGIWDSDDMTMETVSGRELREFINLGGIIDNVTTKGSNIIVDNTSRLSIIHDDYILVKYAKKVILVTVDDDAYTFGYCRSGFKSGDSILPVEDIISIGLPVLENNLLYIDYVLRTGEIVNMEVGDFGLEHKLGVFDAVRAKVVADDCSSLWGFIKSFE